MSNASWESGIIADMPRAIELSASGSRVFPVMMQHDGLHDGAIVTTREAFRLLRYMRFEVEGLGVITRGVRRTAMKNPGRKRCTA